MLYSFCITGSDNMLKIRQISACLIVLLAILSSCQDDPIIVLDKKTMKELVIPEGFNFEMMKLIQVSVQLPSHLNYSSTSRIVEIWSENTYGQPDKLIKTGSSNNKGVFEESISVPIPSKKLFTHCFAGWRSFTLQGSGLKLTGGVFNIDYNIGYGNTPPNPKQGIPVVPQQILKAPCSPLKTGIENVLKNGDFSINKFGKIDFWFSPIEEYSTWFTTDEASGYGSIISQEGNSFARINSTKLTQGGLTQIVNARPGQMVSFSGDVRGFDSEQDVYLYLIPRDINGEYIEVFSYNLKNPGISWLNGTVVGLMPSGTVACQVLFFKISTGIVDFDNAVVLVNDLDSDKDSDGVVDWEDSYPENPGQAYIDFYPGKDKSATLAFEDLWPSQGDYDFNDMVIDYQINKIANAKNQVVEIDLITQVRAIGGSIRNGFGIQLNLPPDQVAGIDTNIEFGDDEVKLNENGTEIGQKLATFIIFTDAYKLLTHPGDGSPTINTTMGYHFVVPSKNTFRIFLKEPVSPDKFSIENFNPFIFRRDDRSREIHLKGFAPTDLANPELFGTGNDVTNPGSSIYYQTKNGMPWAINVPAQFEYTIEKSEILKGYPVFAKWILSSGNDYNDWYLDKQGYRNWDYIYRW